jgi:hypothetical protein
LYQEKPEFLSKKTATWTRGVIYLSDSDRQACHTAAKPALNPFMKTFSL